MNRLNKGIYSSITAYASPVKLSTPQERDLQIKRVWKGYYEAWQPAAAVVIQAHWRGFWTRKRLRARRTGRLLRCAAQPQREDSAAGVIQRFVRGFLGRLQARERRRAAVTIQRWWRGYRERRGWRRRLRDFRWRRDAAVDIQRFARGFLVRRRLRLGRAGGSSEEERERAATVVQKHFRGMKARKRLKWLRKQYAKRQQYAAVTIQRRYRSWAQQQRSRQLAAAAPPDPAASSAAGVDVEGGCPKPSPSPLDTGGPEPAASDPPLGPDALATANRFAEEASSISASSRTEAHAKPPPPAAAADPAASASPAADACKPMPTPQPRPPSKAPQPNQLTPRATRKQQVPKPGIESQAQGGTINGEASTSHLEGHKGLGVAARNPLPQPPVTLRCSMAEGGSPAGGGADVGAPPSSSPCGTPRTGRCVTNQPGVPARQQQRQHGGSTAVQQQRQGQRLSSSGSNLNLNLGSSLQRSASEQLPRRAAGGFRGLREAPLLQRSASEAPRPSLQRRPPPTPPPPSSGLPGRTLQKRAAAAAAPPLPAAAAVPAGQPAAAAAAAAVQPNVPSSRSASSTETTAPANGATLRGSQGVQHATQQRQQQRRQLQPSSRLPAPEAAQEVGTFNVIHHQVMSLKRGGKLQMP